MRIWSEMPALRICLRSARAAGTEAEDANVVVGKWSDIVRLGRLRAGPLALSSICEELRRPADLGLIAQRYQRRGTKGGRPPWAEGLRPRKEGATLPLAAAAVRWL